MKFLRFVLTGILLLAGVNVFAQQAAAVDSMKNALVKAKTVTEKAEWLDILSRTLMNVNLEEAEKYGQQYITMAEESRDRTLMIKAYISNGTRCSYFSGVKDYTERAAAYYNKALDMAKRNRIDNLAGKALIRLSTLSAQMLDKDKSLSYANQAFSLISTLHNDTLMVDAYNAFGDAYLIRNEKTLALRNYLNALRTAEERNLPSSMRTSYSNLSTFYSTIADYDRAIDYMILANKMLDKMKERNVPYMRTADQNAIGTLYSQKNEPAIAISYFEKMLSMADSLKFSSLKVPAYISLINQYIKMDQPQKALDYFNSPAGQNLKKYLNDFGFAGAIDQGYGIIYTKLNKLDSAKYYMERAGAEIESSGNVQKLNYYTQMGYYYQASKEYPKAIEVYLKVKSIADQTGQLEIAEKAAQQLDSLYAKTGNFQLASQYNSIYYRYKDSIETLNKEKELAQVEAADEQQRQARLLREKEESVRRKNNIQYMAITIGIVALFVTLVILGMFKVSAGAIRALGFFVFLLFFEFIFLIFKKNIYAFTHGEPWRDLAFMIALAALLVPLHHWMEKKVLNYLTSHNRLTRAGKGLKEKIFSKAKRP